MIKLWLDVWLNAGQINMCLATTAGLAKDCTVGLRYESGYRCPILIPTPDSESSQKNRDRSFDKKNQNHLFLIYFFA